MVRVEVMLPTTDRPVRGEALYCGNLQCRAYMEPGRATAKATITHIKRDILRSVYSRAKNLFHV